MSKNNENIKGVAELRKFSFIAYAIERLFWVFQCLSPINWFAGSRVEIQRQFDNAPWAEKERLTQKRGKQIEVYVCVCFSLEILILLLINIAFQGHQLVQYLLLLPIVVRLFDIFQTNVNISIFDHLRTSKDHYISNAVRLLVLVLINYFEVILCFAAIYSALITPLIRDHHWANAVYFSIMTQLTLGYGEWWPESLLQAAPCIQGLFGFLFTVLIIARIINILPLPKPIMGGCNEGKESK